VALDSPSRAITAGVAVGSVDRRRPVLIEAVEDRRRSRQSSASLARGVCQSFVDEDIENVLGLFFEFNRGTHGRAGKFSLHQLGALKRRVEDTLFFVLRIGTPSE
jgi:hypothetical protein